MGKPRPWQVGEHEPLEQLDDDLWHVAAEVPGMPIGRHMVVVRLTSGALLIHNAVCLDEPSMAQLEQLGPPTYLIVPNGRHRLDAHAYKQRYPDVEVFTPGTSRKKAEQVVPITGTYEDLSSDPHLHVEMLDGGKEGVFVYANRANENTLIFNDTLFNLPARLPGFKGFMVRAMGSAGGPKVTRLATMFAVTDRDKLAAHLHRLAQAKPRCIIPGHGGVIFENAAETLAAVARKLSPRAVAD